MIYKSSDSFGVKSYQGTCSYVFHLLPWLVQCPLEILEYAVFVLAIGRYLGPRDMADRYEFEQPV